MKLFRKFPPHAPESAHVKDQEYPESTTPEQTPHQQRADSAGDSKPTKADEMMRLMSERKERHKTAW